MLNRFVLCRKILLHPIERSWSPTLLVNPAQVFSKLNTRISFWITSSAILRVPIPIGISHLTDILSYVEPFILIWILETPCLPLFPITDYLEADIGLFCWMKQRLIAAECSLQKPISKHRLSGQNQKSYPRQTPIPLDKEISQVCLPVSPWEPAYLPTFVALIGLTTEAFLIPALFVPAVMAAQYHPLRHQKQR